jgi:ParB family chromosome partitioning protein
LDARSVSRYIRLSHLTPELLNRADNGEIGLYPAVSVSYLTHNEQTELNCVLSESSYKLDIKKAETMRSFSGTNKLTAEKMRQILSGNLSKRSAAIAPVKIKSKILQKYFNAGTPQSEIEAVIVQALEKYFAQHKI